MLLRGFNSISDSTLTNDIRNNIVSFFDYGLLQKGNFINVSIPTSGIYGGLEHRLRLAQDPRRNGNKVWQAFKQNWVWESGFGALVNSGDPTYPGVSGIYINSIFYPRSTTGIYEYYINHNLGQVVFKNTIPSNSVIEVNYSYKYINVTEVDGLNWFEEIYSRADRSETIDFINQSGYWGNLAENRFQLPAIGVELVGDRNFKPYQLGGGQKVYNSVLFHCVANDKYVRDHLVDIVSLQNETEFRMYDLNLIASNNKFPVDHRGVPVSGAYRYPDLVKYFEGKGLRLFDMYVEEMYTLGSLYVGTVKSNSEVIVM